MRETLRLILSCSKFRFNTPKESYSRMCDYPDIVCTHTRLEQSEYEDVSTGWGVYTVLKPTNDERDILSTTVRLTLVG